MGTFILPRDVCVAPGSRRQHRTVEKGVRWELNVSAIATTASCVS